MNGSLNLISGGICIYTCIQCICTVFFMYIYIYIQSIEEKKIYNINGRYCKLNQIELVIYIILIRQYPYIYIAYFIRFAECNTKLIFILGKSYQNIVENNKTSLHTLLTYYYYHTRY